MSEDLQAALAKAEARVARQQAIIDGSFRAMGVEPKPDLVTCVEQEHAAAVQANEEIERLQAQIEKLIGYFHNPEEFERQRSVLSLAEPKLSAAWLLACGCEPAVEHCDQCDARRKEQKEIKVEINRKLLGPDPVVLSKDLRIKLLRIVDLVTGKQDLSEANYNEAFARIYDAVKGRK